jgi:hypothetical protein
VSVSPTYLIGGVPRGRSELVGQGAAIIHLQIREASKRQVTNTPGRRWTKISVNRVSGLEVGEGLVTEDDRAAGSQLFPAFVVWDCAKGWRLRQ